MKKIIYALIFLLTSTCVFGQNVDFYSEIVNYSNPYFGKTYAVFVTGDNYEYNIGKRTYEKYGKPLVSDATPMVHQIKENLSNLFSWRSPTKYQIANDENYYQLEEMLKASGYIVTKEIADFAKSIDLGFILIGIYDNKQYDNETILDEVLEVRIYNLTNGVVRRRTTHYEFMNRVAVAPAIVPGAESSYEATLEEHTKNLKNLVTDFHPLIWRGRPQLYIPLPTSKLGETSATIIPIANTYRDSSDVYEFYSVEYENKMLHGFERTFVKTVPITKSISHKNTESDKPEMSQCVDVTTFSALPADTPICAVKTDMLHSRFLTAEYDLTPVSVCELDIKGNMNYENHAKQLVNRAVYNAVFNNYSLDLVDPVIAPSAHVKYQIGITDFILEKSIVKFKLTIDNFENGEKAELPFECHLTNCDEAVELQLNPYFKVPIAIDAYEKNTIELYTPSMLAISMNDKFVLSYKDKNGEFIDIAICKLKEWNGQKYILSIKSKLDKKVCKDLEKNYKVYNCYMNRLADAPSKLNKNTSKQAILAAQEKLSGLGNFLKK